MRIENIGITKPRVQASIIWEDRDRPNEDIYVEFSPFPEDVNYQDLTDAFLAACCVLAYWRGEARVTTIDAQICPTLFDNLSEVLACLQSWFYSHKRKPPVIEGAFAKGDCSTRNKILPSAGLFFSGGVDSFATLRHNHTLYEPNDPRYFSKGIFVFGFEMTRESAFAIAEEHMKKAASACSIDLISAKSNLYTICRPDDPYIEFLVNQFEGAFFAAIAHSYGRSLSQIALATTLDLPFLQPNGSHPMLNYSSGRLHYRVDGTRFSRLAKARKLAGWQPAHQFLRVCNQTHLYSPSQINCGRCNKCVGTMLIFCALGILDSMDAFQQGCTLSPEIVQEFLKPRWPFQQALCEELVPLLQKRGATALSIAVSERLKQFVV